MKLFFQNMTKIKLYVHTFYEKRYFMNGKGEILLDCEKEPRFLGMKRM